MSIIRFDLRIIDEASAIELASAALDRDRTRRSNLDSQYRLADVGDRRYNVTRAQLCLARAGFIGRHDWRLE